jgi:hypothetical protein
MPEQHSPSAVQPLPVAVQAGLAPVLPPLVLLPPAPLPVLPPMPWPVVAPLPPPAVEETPPPVPVLELLEVTEPVLEDVLVWATQVCPTQSSEGPQTGQLEPVVPPPEPEALPPIPPELAVAPEPDEGELQPTSASTSAGMSRRRAISDKA